MTRMCQIGRGLDIAKVKYKPVPVTASASVPVPASVAVPGSLPVGGEEGEGEQGGGQQAEGEGGQVQAVQALHQIIQLFRWGEIIMTF